MVLTDEWYAVLEKAKSCSEFKYEMFVGEQTRWLPIVSAGKTSNSYFVPTRLAGNVMLPDGTIRKITPEERTLIYDIADEWDANH